MKTMIIGYSGSGKSTLAKTIADKEGVPSLFLDTVHWLPGWKERPREEEIKIVILLIEMKRSNFYVFQNPINKC